MATSPLDLALSSGAATSGGGSTGSGPVSTGSFVVGGGSVNGSTWQTTLAKWAPLAIVAGAAWFMLRRK